ncbi:MAG TPA: hypothetical protein VMU92_07755 [Acidobacteriaceae bacterium]|nr:hypothetical protein [Acidobacteriaceae bacterium]
MKVMDLPDWPPSSFSRAIGPGDTLPTHASQVTIGDIRNILENCVLFDCVYGNQTVSCSFFMPDRDTAKRVAVLLRAHKGENLLAIRQHEIPAD